MLKAEFQRLIQGKGGSRIDPPFFLPRNPDFTGAVGLGADAALRQGAALQ